MDRAIARRLRRGVAGDLIRRFSDVAGTAPSGYLHQWRMDLTSQRLRRTDGAAETVARAACYISVLAFTRAFTRAHSRSPGSFRRAFVEVANRSAKDRNLTLATLVAKLPGRAGHPTAVDVRASRYRSPTEDHIGRWHPGRRRHGAHWLQRLLGAVGVEVVGVDAPPRRAPRRRPAFPDLRLAFACWLRSLSATAYIEVTAP
ncbi:AraC family transcriptional regulator [Streptomyces sp. NPDC094048]|uniref:AraC family transcriptional regulator n=1 Tax=unclassified Streptomyces TaxID=2593676 RepID=UPI0033299AC2